MFNRENSPDIATLIDRLSDDDNQTREDAAAALAKIVDARIPEPVRKRISVEKDFRVNLALHYALACQGNREPLQLLIDSLRQTGHMGANYLRYATGEDFGWDLASWQVWYDATTDDEFREFVDRRWKRKPMMDEWGEFASLFGKEYFGSMTDAETDKPINPGDQLTAEEVKRLEELPTAKAWNLFESAIRELQEKGNRKEAAQLFRNVANEYPNTFYADDSKELADLLDTMVAEDEQYKAPADVDSLALKDQIAFHIHNLRDVVAYQFTQPGNCDIFFHIHLTGAIEDETVGKSYNAAFALREIGEPAVPYLIELLDDRRPIRAVGYWRNFYPIRTVLRYQDAAAQIISAIRSKAVYNRRSTSSYFSNECEETRKAIIDELKSPSKPK